MTTPLLQEVGIAFGHLQDLLQGVGMDGQCLQIVHGIPVVGQTWFRCVVQAHFDVCER